MGVGGVIGVGAMAAVVGFTEAAALTSAPESVALRARGAAGALMTARRPERLTGLAIAIRIGVAGKARAAIGATGVMPTAGATGAT